MPLLFLSHSGIDTEKALDLKRRLEASPSGQEAGLNVWFDKNDLQAGYSWQSQLENVITQESTSFAVYVGSKGVMNWVESEVRLGLSRANGGDYPFIPILADGSKSSALPPFARQYQSVRDPLNDPDEMAKLVAAVLGRDGTHTPVLTNEPFVGLRAMTEAESDRFFGRKDEVNELVGKLRQNRLVADGARIVSAGIDGTVRVWSNNIEVLVGRSIALLPRCLTANERKVFVLNPEGPPWCERFKEQTSVIQPQ